MINNIHNNGCKCYIAYCKNKCQTFQNIQSFGISPENVEQQILGGHPDMRFAEGESKRATLSSSDHT